MRKKLMVPGRIQNHKGQVEHVAMHLRPLVAASKYRTMCNRLWQVLLCLTPSWRQPRGKSMVYLVNSHTNANRIGWHLWEIDLRFAPGLPPGWLGLGWQAVVKLSFWIRGTRPATLEPA